MTRYGTCYVCGWHVRLEPNGSRVVAHPPGWDGETDQAGDCAGSHEADQATWDKAMDECDLNDPAFDWLKPEYAALYDMPVMGNA